MLWLTGGWESSSSLNYRNHLPLSILMGRRNSRTLSMLWLSLQRQAVDTLQSGNHVMNESWAFLFGQRAPPPPGGAVGRVCRPLQWQVGPWMEGHCFAARDAARGTFVCCRGALIARCHAGIIVMLIGFNADRRMSLDRFGVRHGSTWCHAHHQSAHSRRSYTRSHEK